MKYRVTNKLLNFAQRQLNKAYEEDGLTDEILNLQLKINHLRAEYDIAEEDKFLQ